MLLTSEEDVQLQVIQILKEHGSVVAGTPSGDFEVTKIPEIHEWVITADYPEIMTCVSLEEGKNKSNLA